MEFVADNSSPLHNPQLEKNREIVLVCSAGGMAALTGKTLVEMGYTDVKNVGAIGIGSQPTVRLKNSFKGRLINY